MSNFMTSEARTFLLALAGALLMSATCLTAALSPANAAPIASSTGPALL